MKPCKKNDRRQKIVRTFVTEREFYNYLQSRGQKDLENKDADEGQQSSNDESEDGDRKRKRAVREIVRGCNESEIRRFLKSFKKFPKPLERLFCFYRNNFCRLTWKVLIFSSHIVLFAKTF